MLVWPSPKVILPSLNIPKFQGVKCTRQFLLDGFFCCILKWLHLFQLFTLKRKQLLLVWSCRVESFWGRGWLRKSRKENEISFHFLSSHVAQPLIQNQLGKIFFQMAIKHFGKTWFKNLGKQVTVPNVSPKMFKWVKLHQPGKVLACSWQYWNRFLSSPMCNISVASERLHMRQSWRKGFKTTQNHLTCSPT